MVWIHAMLLYRKESMQGLHVNGVIYTYTSHTCTLKWFFCDIYMGGGESISMHTVFLCMHCYYTKGVWKKRGMGHFFVYALVITIHMHGVAVKWKLQLMDNELDPRPTYMWMVWIHAMLLPLQLQRGGLANGQWIWSKGCKLCESMHCYVTVILVKLAIFCVTWLQPQ